MHLDHTVSKYDAPLLNDENAFKLATFGTNNSSGCTMTSAEGTIQGDWHEMKRIVLAAEAAGLDAMVPVARWKGFGGDVNFNDRSFETFTWAAGLGAITERIQLIATTHVPTAHPIRVAKEGSTVDHITDGRFGLNIVAGWNEAEFAMFGLPQRPHDTRYDVADEWIELTRRLWTEDTFDYVGEYFQAPGAHSRPAPVQDPYPLIMSAGASGRGQQFAARWADINFIQGPDIPSHAEKAAAVRTIAREQYEREISVMGMGYVVCADTEKEAHDYFDYYVHEKGDWDGVAALVGAADTNIQSMDFKTRQVAINLIAGYSAQPLIGTPEQVVDGMIKMSEAGLDGITLSWVNFEEGLPHFQEKILPLMVQAGLRKEVAASAPAAGLSATPAGA
jgi:FMNH2-dependent dimethyl sulfone monooxygenase